MSSSSSYEKLSHRLTAKLEQDLAREGKNIVDILLKNADREIKSAVKSLLSLALEEATQSLITGEALSANGGNNNLANRFSSVIEALIEKQFNKKSTEVEMRETQRSKTENDKFKQSKGQQQASLASLATSGQRNL